TIPGKRRSTTSYSSSWASPISRSWLHSLNWRRNSLIHDPIRLQPNSRREFPGLILLILCIAGMGFAQNNVPSTSASATLGDRTSDTLSPRKASSPLGLKPDASGNVPQAEMSELLRKVVENDMENEKRSRDYTYTQREEERHLDGKGEVKKVESRTSEVLI